MMRTIITLGIVIALCVPTALFAATLSLSPGTGVYGVGSTWTTQVRVNTAGKPINAVEGTISYNPKELQVLGISKGGSIFSLWTTEPTFSNGTGKITFGGGSPQGYTGGAGTIMSITWKALLPGAPKANYTAGSVLAADGLGTNVLTGMNGGAFTITAQSNTPTPEAVTPPASPGAAPEYVAPQNTPAAPKVESKTHPNPEEWYTATTAELSWSLPNGATQIRTLLDQNKSTIPTKVGDPVKEKTITDLSGSNYFHIQLKNSDGWGKVTHFRLAVDNEKPESFVITSSSATDTPVTRLRFDAKDATSGILRYEVQIDGGEKNTWVDTKGDGIYELPTLSPGEHIVSATAFDRAQNSITTTYTYTVLAFDAPQITDYPEEISERIIPVIKGATKPDATVTVTIRGVGFEPRGYKVSATSEGSFTIIPDGRLSKGVYDIVARAELPDGSQSRASEPVRIVVRDSAITRVGTSLITILSIIIPLLGLALLLTLLLIYTIHHLRRLRAQMRTRVHDAEDTLREEVGAILTLLKNNIDELRAAKSKITKGEIALLQSVEKEVETAATHIDKKLRDIERTIER
jgi:hypothetical protein